jgi:hypothetical protein
MLLANYLTENPLFAIGVVLVAGALLLMVTRRNIRRRESVGGIGGGVRSAPRAGGLMSSSPDRSRRDLQESMEKLLLELEQLSREINSQVDTRLRALNLLIREADEKIAQMRRLQGLPEDGGPDGQALPSPRPEPHPEVTSERYARVYHLAERGLSVVEIAHELDMLTGEVELILALRRTGAGAGGDRA